MVNVDLNFIFDYSTPTLIILMRATPLTTCCTLANAMANMSQSYRCVAMVIIKNYAFLGVRCGRNIITRRPKFT